MCICKKKLRTFLQLQRYIPTFMDLFFLIGRQIQWSPRSPNLNTLDYFFWAYLKNQFHKQRYENIDSLKANVRKKINLIVLWLCERQFEQLKNFQRNVLNNREKWEITKQWKVFNSCHFHSGPNYTVDVIICLILTVMIIMIATLVMPP